MSIDSKILKVLASVLEIPSENLAKETELSMDALPEWDSLTHTELIVSLEREFGTTFDTARASQATDLEALIELVAG